ncbi:MAG: hypothetical protein ACRDRZ_12755, partial [Pseudonocardiaceae bacterium]
PDGGGNDSGTAALAVLGGLLMLAAIPGLLRILVRRRRWARAGDATEAAEAAWKEIRDTLLDLRHGWKAITPRRTAALLRDQLRHSEPAVAAMDRVALAVEKARFARAPSDDARIRADVETICAALRERESRGDRIRARVLPRSLRISYRRWLASRPVSSQTRDDDASVLPSSP